jgi:hypothetical protein
MKEHEFLLNIDMERAALLIQELNPNPSLEDLSAFQKCLDLIIQAKPYIHDSNDLSLLIHQIETMPDSKSTSVYTGILIGKRDELFVRFKKSTDTILLYGR